jgi:hypothetical protein
MGRDLPQFLLLFRRQIRLNVFRVTPNQINTTGNHSVKVDNPGAATLSFPFGCPSQLPNSARPRNRVARIRMVDQINGYGLNAIRSDERHSLGLELRQLQDRNLRPIFHCPAVYRNAA